MEFLQHQNGERSTELQVFAMNEGMNVIVSAGNAFIANRWFENPSDFIITISQNSNILTRIDSIIAQIDKTQAGRSGNIVYRQGTASSNPTHPTINTEENIYELRLADIIVSPSCVKITQDLITDCRGSEDCQWITSLIKQVDTSTLFVQWQEAYKRYFEESKQNMEGFYQEEEQAFLTWFSVIKEKLDGDTAGNLLNLVDEIKLELNSKSNIPRRKIITLLSTGWTLNEETQKYEYKIEDTTITEDDDIDVRIEDEEQEEALADAEVRLYTYNGYYVFFAKELVEVDIEAEIIITRTKLDTGEVQNNAS